MEVLLPDCDHGLLDRVAIASWRSILDDNYAQQCSNAGGPLNSPGSGLDSGPEIKPQGSLPSHDWGTQAVTLMGTTHNFTRPVE